MFTGSKEESTHAEIGLRVSIDGLRGVRLLADGLHKAHATVGLQGFLRQIVPSLLDDGLVFLTLQQSVVHAPQHTVGEEGGA